MSTRRRRVSEETPLRAARGQRTAKTPSSAIGDRHAVVGRASPEGVDGDRGAGSSAGGADRVEDTNPAFAQVKGDDISSDVPTEQLREVEEVICVRGLG